MECSNNKMASLLITCVFFSSLLISLFADPGMLQLPEATDASPKVRVDSNTHFRKLNPRSINEPLIDLGYPFSVCGTAV